MSKEYKASIADEDAHDWMKTLFELGFDMHEIDQIMTHLNDTYVENKFGNSLVDKISEEFRKVAESKHMELTADLEAEIRKWAIQHIRDVA